MTTIEELARVECAQCGRRVDRVDAWREKEGLGDGRSVVVFRCHGETERVEVYDRELSEMFRLGAVDVTVSGRAFQFARTVRASFDDGAKV